MEHQIERGQALWNGLFTPRRMEGSTSVGVAGIERYMLDGGEVVRA